MLKFIILDGSYKDFIYDTAVNEAFNGLLVI